jgi:hypothetical protein
MMLSMTQRRPVCATTYDVPYLVAGVMLKLGFISTSILPPYFFARIFLIVLVL